MLGRPKDYSRRLLAVWAIFSVLSVLLLARVVWIQALRYPWLSALGRKQHQVMLEIPQKRGAIYDRQLRELAGSLMAPSVFADPKLVTDPQGTAERLAPLLGLPADKILSKMARGKRFAWLARKVAPETARAVEQLKLPGIAILKEPKRFYPNGELASHVLGFVDVDGRGLEGLERGFDKILSGAPGSRLTHRDARRKLLPRYETILAPARDGLAIVTTLDEVIQAALERELDAIVEQYRAKGACGVVLDPWTGDILALANRPTYNPNVFWEGSDEARRNRVVTDLFEPGSTFKMVTAGAALDTHMVAPTDTFDCENGAYRFAGHILHDHKPHGVLTFQEVIELSSNIGTCKVAQIIGPDVLYHYMKGFGFGERTGISLPGEVVGVAKPPSQWSKVSITNIPMGQEVAVTAIQLACAASVVANGGLLVRPRLVLEVRSPEGAPVEEFQSEVRRRVLSAEACRVLKDFMRGVVDRGTGKLGKVPGYPTAGKTGTAQKLEENGAYSHSKFVASFVGFVPVDEPVLAMAITVDEPHPYYFGGVVAAPVFRRVAESSLKYLQVPTQEVPEKFRLALGVAPEAAGVVE